MFTTNDYITNLTTVKSESLMARHLKDAEFDDNWSTYVVLRSLLCSASLSQHIMRYQPMLENLKDAKCLYKTLFQLVKYQNLKYLKMLMICKLKT